jgi:hypothetical protein
MDSHRRDQRYGAGGALRFRVAGSVIQGEGKWSLTDDYPGSVQISLQQVSTWSACGCGWRQAAGRREIAGAARAR